MTAVNALSSSPLFGNVGVPVPACRTTEIRRTRIVGSHR